MLPLIKYPGGKRNLAKRILASLGSFESERLYIEPFLGSGAVFFARPVGGASILADVNPRIVAFHRAVQQDVEGVIRAIESMPWGPEFALSFDRIRDEYNAGPYEGSDHAARLLWLNRASFNGVYRENRRGVYNVPVGDYKTATPPTPGALREASAALQDALLLCGSFQATLRTALTCAPRDRWDVYADPPYVPAKAGGFTSYSGAFDSDDQRQLAQALAWAAEGGARVTASNHDVPLVREIYAQSGAAWELVELFVKRSVSRSATGRQPAGELLLIAGPEAVERCTRVQD